MHNSRITTKVHNLCDRASKITTNRLALRHDTLVDTTSAPEQNPVSNQISSQKIGEGGMGSIYLSEGPKGKRVLKLLDRAKTGPQFLASLEAESLATVAPHSNIIDVYHVSQVVDSNGILTGGIIECEYLEGHDLSKVLSNSNRFNPSQTAQMLMQISSALAKLAAFSIIHRDIKPENIFEIPMPEGSKYKLIDFGIATYLTKEIFNVEDTAFGTPAYMAPEQVRGLRHINTDIYALGVTVIELMSGTLPFQGSAVEIMRLKLTNPAITDQINDLWPKDDLAVKLLAIIQKCVEIDPDNRPSAKALNDQIIQLLSPTPMFFYSHILHSPRVQI